MCEIVTHELVEAITDPTIQSYYSYDILPNSLAEVCDICQSSYWCSTGLIVDRETSFTYVVATYWSNRMQSCVAGSCSILVVNVNLTVIFLLLLLITVIF